MRRCVWVQVLGIPPHAWSRENVESIVKNFGKVKWMETKLDESPSMEVVKLLIQTDLLHFINGGSGTGALQPGSNT